MPSRQSVSRTLDAPPSTVFALLADPSRHQELDGSGTVCGVVDGEPITGVGQRFRMAMNRPGRADYQVDNIVTVFEPDVAIGWATTEVDGGTLGYEWSYRLAPAGVGGTHVGHAYDWSRVSDPDLRSRFPQVSEAEMAQTLELLAAAVERWGSVDR